MLLNPVCDDGALAIIDIETNAEADADGAADDGRYVDGSTLGERERNVDGLADGKRHGRLKLHTSDGEVTAFSGYAVGTAVTADYDVNFERDARWTTDLATELKLGFRRDPTLRGRTAPENSDE